MAEFKVASAYADFEVKVDEGIDAAITKIKARGKEMDTTAKVVLDADTTAAKAKIKGLGDSKEKATVQVDADTALARAKLKGLGDDKVTVPKIKPEVDQAAARKAEEDIVTPMSRAAARTNAQFSALAFGALSVGLPAAAAVGAAGVGLSMAAAGAAFIGAQYAAQGANDQIGRSFAALQTNVTSSTEAMSSQFGSYLAPAVDKVGAAFNRLKPQIQTAFLNSDQAIEPLTGAVTDLAENAMPGLVTSTEHMQAPLQGLRSLAAQTGSGLTDFFTNASTGAASAGQNLSTLGGIVQQALGFLGQLFANVSNNGVPAMSQLQAMLHEAEGALIALTSSGSGAIGFLQGFSSGATGMLTIVNLLANGLALLPPQVTQLAGSVTAAGLVLSKFGIDGTKAFDGLGDRMKTAKASSEPLKNSISELATTAFNPAMLATAGFGIALDLLGQHQRDAAAAAQAQTERVQSLAQALRESNGAIDDNVRATAAQNLQQFKAGDGTRNLLEDSRQLGVSLPLLTSAYLGSGVALGSLNTSLDASIKAHTTFEATHAGTRKVLDSEGVAYQQLKDNINSGDFSKATQDNKDLASASAATVKPTTELSSAMDTLSGTTATTADKVTALKSALDILSGRTPVFEDAIKQGNDALRGMADGLKNGTTSADGMGKSLINVDGTINTVSKNGSSLQGLAEGLQGSFVNAASGIDQMVRRGVPFAQATKTVNDSLQTQRDRFIEVAGKMGIASKEAGALADKYGLIPNTIVTDVTSDTKQAKAAIDALPAYAAGTQGAMILSAVTDPATGKINETVQYADGSKGTITLDGFKDPVTGKTLAAVQFADGSKGTMTIDGVNQLAKEGAISAVRFADGQTGTVTIKGNASQAYGTVNAFLNSYLNSVITIPVRAAPAPGSPPIPLHAKGTVPGYADGVVAGTTPSALSVGQGGLLKGPGTGTSDDILAWMSTDEAVINAKSTANNAAELAAINSGQRDYSKYPDTGRPPSGSSRQSTTGAAGSPITINVHPPADVDVYVLATMVSRELELRRKVA